MNQIIEPKILKGTRDVLPQDMAKRQYVMNTFAQVFTRFGYDTIETPALEYAETLLGKYGEEGSKLLYKFKDNGGRDVALRYDQTVPTARLVAMYANDLPMPFKRYQISKVWRADKPAKGRYREFYQCDIDIIGTDSLVADAEVIAVISKVMQALGIENYVIKMNNRKFINSVLEQLNIPQDSQTSVIQLLDKLDKVDRAVIGKELEQYISKEQIEGLFSVVLQTGTNEEKLEALKQYNVKDIVELFKLLPNFGVPAGVVQFDPALARGLDYYTGTIVETILPDLQLGSVCGGGRYDDLCSMFTKQQFSGVGVAFGFDRLMVALEELNKLNAVGLNAQALVTYFDEATLSASIAAATELQTNTVNAELYFEPAKLAKQFKYADKKQIPFVVMIGSDEVQNNTVTIKMMKTGKQKTIPRSQLVAYFQGLNTL